MDKTRTVKTKNAEDFFAALLSYRVIPLPWFGRSPAELLVNRKLCSCFLQNTASLENLEMHIKSAKSNKEKL